MNETTQVARPNLNNLRHRHNVGMFLRDHHLLGDVVEIGVLHGGFSEIVLDQWPGQHYYMVDLWEIQSPQVYKENQANYFVKYREALDVAKRFGGRARVIALDSILASRAFDDNSLDWVYIDANHALEAVRADIEAWFPKVKSGGIFSGHDYVNNTTWPKFCQVKTAVDEWSQRTGIPIVTTPCESWWSIKP